MKEDVKDLVVSALRSGEYKQGKGVLRHYDCHCVLGVFCDLYIKHNPGKAEWTTDTIQPGMYGFRNVGASLYFVGSLPDVVCEWAGLKQHGCIRDNEGHTEAFETLNDYGMSFSELADLIEAQYESL